MHLSVFTPGDKVLLIGEGNFSFSADLVDLVQLDITATCVELEVISETAESNVQKLQERGARVYLGVDATKLAQHPVLGQQRFDKVVFNFPHVGGKMKLGLNRALLRQFLGNAAGLLVGTRGRVVVSLCRGQGGTPLDDPARPWGDTWQAVEMAAPWDLVLEEVLPFQRQLFPGYSCVGYRGRDAAFHLKGALVHVFRPAGPLLPLVPSPGDLPSAPARYLCQQLEDWVRVRCPFSGLETLSLGALQGSLLHRAFSSWSDGDSGRVLLVYGAVPSPALDDFSLPPMSLWAVLVGRNSRGLCADFVAHVLSLFRKLDRSCVSRDAEVLRCQDALPSVTKTADIHVVVGDSKVLVGEECCCADAHASVVRVDELACVLFGCENWREMVAQGARVLLAEGSAPALRRASLHPRPHVLDVTFRQPEGFSAGDLYEALWQLAGEVITAVQLLNVYQSPEGWTSRCYRITYQSFARAMSRDKAIMVHHSIVGLGLTQKLGVTIF